MAEFSPIRALTVTGTATYRLNPVGFNEHKEINPQVTVSMHDLPRGFDIVASYISYITKYLDGVSDVSTGENISGYFYPGEYVDALKRFAVYAYIAQETWHRLPKGAQTITHILFPDELMTSKRTFHEGGLLFFPTDNLLLSTLNSRFWDMNTGEIRYNTDERVGLWLKSGSKLEAGAGVSKSQARQYLYADALYEHRWANGLMTGAGAFGSRLTDKDSADADINVGPVLTASITKDLSGQIRSIENSHNLRVTVIRGDSLPAPGIEYAFYFRLKMLPDISIVAELGANIHGQKAGSMWGGAFLHAGF
jgi:hypothetical protein